MHLMNGECDQISHWSTKSDISCNNNTSNGKLFIDSDTLLGIISNMLKRIYTPLHRSHTKWINLTVIRISTFFRILILWHIIGICLCAGKSFYYYYLNALC